MTATRAGSTPASDSARNAGRVPEWAPPGPGVWVVDRSHSLGGPTRFFKRIAETHTSTAYREALREFGAVLDTIEMRFVNGAMYRRLVPLVGARFDRGTPPPKAAMWLATRIHPVMRRENRNAVEMVENRRYLDRITDWERTERAEWVAKNRELQGVDPAALSDSDLADHLALLDRHLATSWIRHHRLHAYDLGPIGDLLYHAAEWEMDSVEVMLLLKGASPATLEAADHGTRIAAALTAAGVNPLTIMTVDDIKAVPDAAAALDAYLADFGYRLIVGYDIDGKSLHELPNAICALVKASAAPAAGDDGADRMAREARLRDACPDPALFDELLDGARRAYGLRDDNGPLTWSWPAGLLRRAYLDAGRRLVSGGAFTDQELVFELDTHELVEWLRSGTNAGDGTASVMTASRLQERAEEREWESQLEAPEFLGPNPPDTSPDLSALPTGLRRSMGIVVAATALLEPDVHRDNTPLTGLGIGAASYRGVARVCDDPAEAIAEMEPGDVLVAPFTAPSFNAVLAVAGAVVIEEGGLLCHAAVMARELDLPAVIGCQQAMQRISTGDLVEVDPSSGIVTIVT